MMQNKFEALKAFQSWPRGWQELCAEYWASDEEPDQQRFTAINLEVAKIPTTIRNPFDCIDKGEMKLEATLEPSGRTKYTLREIDFLESLIHGGFKAPAAIERFCERFGDLHPHDSIYTKYYKRRRVLIERGEFKQ